MTTLDGGNSSRPHVFEEVLNSYKKFKYSEVEDLKPEEIIQQRFGALKTGDFKALYNSYHSEAPFVEQFPDEKSYLDFASQTLREMKIIRSHIGDWRKTAEGIEVICGLQFELNGQTQYLYELALLKIADGDWRYHSAQKLTGEEFSGSFAQLDFELFDQQASKIRF